MCILMSDWARNDFICKVSPNEDGRVFYQPFFFTLNPIVTHRVIIVTK